MKAGQGKPVHVLPPLLCGYSALFSPARCHPDVVPASKLHDARQIHVNSLQYASQIRISTGYLLSASEQVKLLRCKVYYSLTMIVAIVEEESMLLTRYLSRLRSHPGTAHALMRLLFSCMSCW